jgi:hypothetical protein
MEPCFETPDGTANVRAADIRQNTDQARFLGVP